MSTAQFRFVQRFNSTQIVTKEQCNEKCLREPNCASFQFREPVFKPNYITCYLFTCFPIFESDKPVQKMINGGEWQMVHYDRAGATELFFSLKKDI